MINFLFRVLLSFSATSWMLAVYLIKTRTSFLGLPMIVAALIYIIKNSFIVKSNEDLSLVLYGIGQRFYTTPVGGEKRIANSVIKL